MANFPDASSALLSYIDALLVDEEVLLQPAREPEALKRTIKRELNL